MTKTEFREKIKEATSAFGNLFIELNNILLNDVDCIHRIENTCYEYGEDETKDCSVSDCDDFNRTRNAAVEKMDEELNQYEKETYPDRNEPWDPKVRAAQNEG